MAGDPFPKPVREPKIVQRQLKARSHKREQIAAERRFVVAETLAARPRCEFAVADLRCDRASTDVHERTRRSQGGGIVYSQGISPEDLVSLCFVHHAWCHDNPTAAAFLGFLDMPKSVVL
jgi:hypothetical protein